MEMRNKNIKIITFLGIIIVFIELFIIMANAQFVKTNNSSMINITEKQKILDMLIFISPQYNQDAEIILAINNYIQAVKTDIYWNATIIKITEENNNYEIIDQLIEEYFLKHKIKACIMLGEDIDTPLAGDCDYMEKPSTVPWFTTGGKNAYETTQQGIISKPYKIDICISLLYPTHELDYVSKKLQIINVFEKFSKRNSEYFEDISVFESSDINTKSKQIYQNINTYANLDYNQDPNNNELIKSLDEYHSMYYIHGHSNPSGTSINSKEKIWFSANNIENIKTPFFGADGCYVSGWWSNQKDNNKLDASIQGPWYGSKIFTSKNIKAMALGLLSQNGYAYNVSFIENVIPKLAMGNTLAESMIGTNTTGDINIFGDPTLQFII
jgi:hypothetical protein